VFEGAVLKILVCLRASFLRLLDVVEAKAKGGDEERQF
jgi:hypothetical protein